MESKKIFATPPQYADIALDEPIPEITVLNEIVPMKDRTYEIACNSCDAQLRFHVQNVSLVPGYLRNSHVIDCPICKDKIVVSHLLEIWVKRNIDACAVR